LKFEPNFDGLFETVKVSKMVLTVFVSEKKTDFSSFSYLMEFPLGAIQQINLSRLRPTSSTMQFAGQTGDISAF
jgi:hypothetical protein